MWTTPRGFAKHFGPGVKCKGEPLAHTIVGVKLDNQIAADLVKIAEQARSDRTQYVGRQGFMHDNFKDSVVCVRNLEAKNQG